MHRRHLPFLAATLLTCVTTAASAQRLQSLSPRTYVVVNFGGSFSWTAQEIQWSGAAPDLVAARLHDGTAPAARPGAGTKSASNTVEVIGPAAQSSDAALLQWAQGKSATPEEVTITLMSASGAPAEKYLLHHALVTKLAMNKMDAGAGNVPITRVTITAESVSMAPSGQ